MKRLAATKNGWVRVAIALQNCSVNRSGCFKCPLKLLRNILSSNAAEAPFHINRNEDGLRIYSTPWDSGMYRSYDISVRTSSSASIQTGRLF